MECHRRLPKPAAYLPAEAGPRRREVAQRDASDPAWPYRYRDRYYSRGYYTPIYTGYYYDSYYDRYDTRSFDSSMASSGPASATWGDADHKTGIGDS